MKLSRTALCIVAITLITLPGSAQDWWHTEELVEADHVYSMDYVTPHVEWAKPLPGGPIDALFFVRAKGIGAREIAEMAQRLQIRPRIVYYEDAGDIVAGGEPGMDRALGLIKDGADLFVFADVPFDGLTREAQYHLLEQVVRDGSGLVAVSKLPEIAFTAERIIDDPLPAELATRFPLASLSRGRYLAGAFKLQDPTDAQLAESIITRYRLGEGRALAFRYPGGATALTPRLAFSFSSLDEYEYWAGFAANALRWAAGRDSEVAFTDRPEGPVPLHRDDLPDQLSVAVRSDLPGTAPLTVTTTLKRADGHRVDLDVSTLQCAQGDTVRALPTIPRLPAGDHWMEVVVTSPRGVEAFGAQTISVTSARGVESVALATDFVEAGETIEGSVAMRGQNFAPDERLEIRLRDAEDRVVALAEMEAQGGEVPFALEVPADDYTILMRAEAALLDDEDEVHRAHAQFRVPRRNRGQFNFIMWNTPPHTLGYWAMRSMRDAGVTGYLAGASPPPETVAALDMTYVPYTTRILETVGEDDVMQPVCWNNEPEVTEHIEEIAEKYHPTREHGVYVYSLGDENHTRGACAHPECMDAWRDYLRDQYEQIGALNESWGTQFASFSEIDFYEEGDFNEQAALNAGQFPRWYDRQAFKRFNYAQYCGRYAEAYAAMDPEAITGFEGAGSFGDAYEAIIERVGFWGPYPNIGDDIIRSLAPRDFITSNWMGYSREAAPMVERMWRMISNGYHGAWWWRWDNIGRFHGFIAPDFHPWDDTSKVVVDEMRDIQDGVGTMMLRMEMPHDGIGLLYSMPSAYADGVAPHRHGPLAAAHGAFLEASQDLGFAAHYLSEESVLQGDLNDGDERALLLPLTRALSDEVADEIRQFVRDGGLVIADLRPAIRDGHCRLREAGALDDVFGIAQQPTAPDFPELAEVDLKLADIGGRDAWLETRTRIDPALQITTGESRFNHEGTPLMVINRFGDGVAVLLNFSIEEYLPLREEMREMPIRDLLSAAYQLAGIAPAYEQNADGEHLRWTETVRWETEGLTLLMHFRTDGEDGPATTVLPEAKHVYDLRNDRHLGETRLVGGPLRVGFANIYAITDEPIGEMLASVREDTVPQGGEVAATLRVRNRDQALLPMKLRLFRPDGSEQTWPRREFVAENGVAQVTIPVAFNAMRGTWRLEAREVLSGQTATAEYEVEPR
ncbi:MAG: beta-galactosidase [Armatimonadota bacterium]